MVNYYDQPPRPPRYTKPTRPPGFTRPTKTIPPGYQQPSPYTQSPKTAAARAQSRRTDYIAAQAVNEPPEEEFGIGIPGIIDEPVKERGFWSKAMDVIGIPGEVAAASFFALDPRSGGPTHARAALGELFGDGLENVFSKESWSDTTTKLRDIQKKRGWKSRIASELLLDPLNLLPLAALTKPVKYGIKGIKELRKLTGIAPKALETTARVSAPVVKETLRILKETPIPVVVMPTEDKLMQIIHSARPLGSGKFVQTIAKWKVGQMALNIFGVHLFDITNPVSVAYYAQRIMTEQIDEAIPLIMRRLKVREAARAFKVNDMGMVELGKAGKLTKDYSFQEVFQNPELFGKKGLNLLTREQEDYLKGINDGIEQTVKWMISKGMLDDDILHKVGGNYFPQIWKYIGDEGLLISSKYASGKRALGTIPVKFFEKSRVHEYAAEAKEAGLRGDPVEALSIFFRGIYQRSADHTTAKLMRAKGKGIVQKFLTSPVKALHVSRIAELKHFEDVAGRPVAELGPRRMRIILRDLKKDMPSISQYASRKYGGPLISGPREKPYASIERLKRNRSLMEYNAPLVNELEIASKIADPFIKAKELARISGDAKRAATKMKQQIAELKHYGNIEAALYKATGTQGDKGYQIPAEIRNMMTAGDAFERSNPDMLLRMTNVEWLKGMKSGNNLLLKELRKVMGDEVHALLKTTSSASSAIRATRTGLDFGSQMIQGTVLMFTNPVAWSKAVFRSGQAILDPIGFEKFLSMNEPTLQMLYDTNHLHGAGSDLVEGLKEKAWLKKGATWLADRGILGTSYLGKGAKFGFGVAETQFNMFLLSSKIYLHKGMLPLVEATLKNIDLTKPAGIKQYRDAMYQFNDLMAKMTGTVSMANIGISPTGQAVLGSFMMFAPRYRTAVYSFMKQATVGQLRQIAKPFRIGKLGRGTLEQSIAMESLQNMMAGGITMYLAIAHKLKQEPKLDPSKGSFLTIQIGQRRVGIGSAYVALARFGASFLGSALEDKKQGKLNTIKVLDHDNVMQRFIRSQIAPLSGIAWDGITDRNFMGDPVRGFPENLEFVGDSLLPFWLSNIYDSPRRGWSIPVGMASEFFGMRTFPTSLFEESMDRADIAAMDKYNLTYDRLDKKQQNTVLAENPSIQELMDDNNKIWEGRGEEMNAWRLLRRDADIKFNEKMGAVVEAFDMGDIDGKQFVSILKERNLIKRNDKYQADQQYPEVMQMLEERRAEPPDKREYMRDIELNRYYDVIFAEDELTGTSLYRDKITDEFLFDKYEQNVAAFKKTVNENTWNYIQSVTDSITNPVILELYKGRQQLANYWRMAESILEKTENMSLIPTYQKYIEALPEEKLVMKTQYPWLDQLLKAKQRGRQMIRDNDAKVDAFLVRWGYEDLPRHPLNKQQGMDYIRGTPVLWE